VSDFEKSYLGQIRTAMGDRRIIVPGVRAVIRDGQGRVLLIRRSDNGMWGMPAGAMELDESVADALKREVKEETGLDVISAEPMAIYSEPRFSFTSAYGGKHQMFAFVFIVTEWSGTLVTTTDETRDARFFDPDDLPDDTMDFYRETVDDMLAFDGRFIVK